MKTTLNIDDGVMLRLKREADRDALYRAMEGR